MVLRYGQKIFLVLSPKGVLDSFSYETAAYLLLDFPTTTSICIMCIML